MKAHRIKCRAKEAKEAVKSQRLAFLLKKGYANISTTLLIVNNSNEPQAARITGSKGVIEVI